MNCQFTDCARSSVLLTKDVLRAGSANDDLSLEGRDPDLDSRVSMFSQFSRQQLIELGIEYAVCHKLRTSCKES